MDFDTFPFLAAQRLLTEAADWLNNLILPRDHEARHEPDDAVCLEQAVHHLQMAVDGMSDWATHQTETGGALVDGLWIPEIKSEVVDPQAAAASDEIEAVLAPLRAWEAGGTPVAITPVHVEHLRQLLQPWAARLAGEDETYEAMADAADAGGY